jgi:hypothetical protein
MLSHHSSSRAGQCRQEVQRQEEEEEDGHRQMEEVTIEGNKLILLLI